MDDKLKQHLEVCDAEQRIIIPSKDEKVCFKKYKALQKYPFIIYADFETLAKNIDANVNVNMNTFEYQNHVASSYGFVVVDWKQDIIHSSFYRGEKASERFLDEITAITNLLYEKLNVVINSI